MTFERTAYQSKNEKGSASASNVKCTSDSDPESAEQTERRKRLPP
jgi:hypothetical protein